MKKARVLTTIAVPFLSASVAWLGGYDFDSRGVGVAYGFFSTVVFMFFVWWFPAWHD